AGRDAGGRPRSRGRRTKPASRRVSDARAHLTGNLSGNSSRTVGLCWSLSERIGRRAFQRIARSGSFQATPYSAPGVHSWSTEYAKSTQLLNTRNELPQPAGTTIDARRR